MKIYELDNRNYLVEGKNRCVLYDFYSEKVRTINKDKIIIDKINEIPANIKTTSKFPKTVKIEITDQCNFHCTHCYNLSLNQKCIDFDKVKEIIPFLKNEGIELIELIGGEPFILGNDIFPCIDLIKSHSFSLNIYTNASLITSEIAIELRKYNIYIICSCYGESQEEYQLNTLSKNGYDKFQIGINNLIKYNIPFHINYINCINNTHAKVKDNLPVGKAVNDDNVWQKLKKSKSIVSEKSIIANKMHFLRVLNGNHQCFSYSFYIDNDFNTYPCCMEKRYSYGNIYYDYSETIKKIKISSFIVEECNNCEYRFGCFDCRPLSFSNGFMGKNKFCQYNPGTGKWLVT